MVVSLKWEKTVNESFLFHTYAPALLLVFAILTEVNCNLKVVLNFISLIAKDDGI